MSLPMPINLPASDERPEAYEPPVPRPQLVVPEVPTVGDWIEALWGALRRRRAELELWQRYYDGDQPLSFFTEPFRVAFGNRFRRFASNFVLLVVDGMVDRMEVQGFRFRDPQADADIWDIWQENDLDTGSQQAHTEALIKGSAYVLVEPREGDTPRITVEDACNAVVAWDPRDRRRRLAGLKTWTDEQRHLVVYLYLPTEIYTFRSEKPLDTGWDGEPTKLRAMLKPWDVPGSPWPIINRMGVVPLVPLLNRPRLSNVGRSEVEPITSNQDAINYYRAAAIIAARYMATPQRYIYGLDLEVDKDTGRPKQPFIRSDGSPADLWTMGNPDPGDPDSSKPLFPPQIGQFPAAALDPFVKLIEAEVWQMSAVSRMPYQELLGQPSSIPQSGEGLKSSESPLVRKVGRAEVTIGEGWEEVMKVALRAMDDPRADTPNAETMWLSAETRNEAVRTDSVVKQVQAGIIDQEAAWEELGYSFAQIDRMRKRIDKQAGTEITSTQAEDVGKLIRAGFTPAASLEAVDAPPVPHSGLVSVTLQRPEKAVPPGTPPAPSPDAVGPAGGPPADTTPAPAGPRMSPTQGS